MNAEWAERFGDKIADTLKVIVPNGTVLGFVTLVDIQIVANTLLVLVTIGYTIWRWKRDAKKETKKPPTV